MAQQFDIVGNLLLKVDGAEAGLNKLKNSLSKLKMPEGLENSFKKSFANLDGLLARYKSQVEKGFDTKADVTAFSKTSKALDTELSRISKSFTELTGKEINFRVKSDEIIRAEKELQNLIEKKEQLAKDSLKFSIEGGSKGAKEIESLLEKLKEVAGNTKTGEYASNALDFLKTGNIQAAITQLDKASASCKRFKKDKQDAFQETGFDMSTAIQKIVEALTGAENKFNTVNNEIDQTQSKLSNFHANQVQKAGEYAEKLANDFSKNESAIRRADGAMQEYARSSQSMSQQLQDLQHTTQYFFSLRNMINLFKRGIDDAVQSVKELDKAMTDTAVVTDYRVSDLWGMLPEYTQIANELGATTQGAYETMTLYFQQGLDQQQAFEIGAETMKMARIAGLDYAEATDMMTAALRGFNMELNETSAQRINDVYSKIAAVTASDTEELGTAMQRTASIAHSAGMSFEGTTAFLAQAIETTREPAENLGTAMKTIIARFQELKKNPLEISEVEGEEVDYNKIDAALKTIGVDLKDTNGQFRELDKVFLDISQRWDSLSQTQQRYIATTAAGSRQQSRFIAMMSNYDRTMELVSAANNSAGASEEQFGKTMDSLEAKLNKLHNAWQQFTMGIANNGMIKSAVDGITGLLTITNKLIDTFSLGIGPVKSLLSLLMAFTGLKMTGRFANSLIGGLGGILDPSVGFGKGFLGGAVGARQQASAAQAQMIYQPIVNELRALPARMKEQNVSTDGTNNNAVPFNQQAFKQAKNNIADLTKYGQKYSADAIIQQFKGLSTEQQKVLKNTMIGTSTKVDAALLGRYGAQDKAQEKAIRLAASNYRNQAKIGSIAWSEYYNKVSDPVAMQKALEGNPKVSQATMEWVNGMADQTTAQAKANIARAMESKLYDSGAFDAVTNKQEYQKILNEAAEAKWKEMSEAQQAAARRKAWRGMNPDEPLQNRTGTVLLDSLGKIGAGISSAGMGIQSFGALLTSSANPALQAFGGALTAVGGVLSSVGMGLSGLVSGFNTLTNSGAMKGLASGLSSVLGTTISTGATTGILAGVAALTAIAVSAYKKHVQKLKDAGEKVVKEYTEANEKYTSSINDLTTWQQELPRLQEGVDAYGNNVSLDTSDYDRYREIINGIAELNPDIVEGYNAQGDAIIRNNSALDQTLAKQRELQKLATEDYLSQQSLATLIRARDTTDAFKKDKAAGGSESVVEAHNLISAMRQAGLGDSFFEALGFDYSKLQASHNNPEIQRFIMENEQIAREISEFYDQAGVDIDSHISEGLDNLTVAVDAEKEAIQDVYNNLMTYTSVNHLAPTNLSANLQGSFNKGIELIAKSRLGAVGMQKAVENLSKRYSALTKENSQYNQIMEDVRKGQEEYSRTLDASGYKGEEYRNKLLALAEGEQELADKTDVLQDKIAHTNLAEFYTNEAEKAFSFTNKQITDLTDAFAQFTDEINIAKNAYTDWQKQLENINSPEQGVNSYKQIFDDIFKETEDSSGNKHQYNIEAKGRPELFTGAAQILSEDWLKYKDTDAVANKLKELQPLFKEGQEGAIALGDKIRDALQAGEEFDGHKFSEFFEITDKGVAVKDGVNISDELTDSLAHYWDLQTPALVAALQNASQYGISLMRSTAEQRTAISNDVRASAGVTSHVQDELGRDITDLIVPRDVLVEGFHAAGEYNEAVIHEGIVALREQQGVFTTERVLATKNAEKLQKEYGITQDNFLKVLGQHLGEDEVKETYEDYYGAGSWTEKQQTQYDEIQEGIQGALEETTSEVPDIASSVANIEGMLAAKLYESGDATKFDALDRLDKSIYGNKTIDTAIDRLREGTDNSGNTLTKKQYDQDIKELESALKTNEIALKQLETGQQKWRTDKDSAQYKAYQEAIDKAKEREKYLLETQKLAEDYSKEQGWDLSQEVDVEPYVLQLGHLMNSAFGQLFNSIDSDAIANNPEAQAAITNLYKAVTSNTQPAIDDIADDLQTLGINVEDALRTGLAFDTNQLQTEAKTKGEEVKDLFTRNGLFDVEGLSSVFTEKSDEVTNELQTGIDNLVGSIEKINIPEITSVVDKRTETVSNVAQETVATTLTVDTSDSDAKLESTQQKTHEVADIINQGATFTINVPGIDKLNQAASAASNLSKQGGNQTVGIKASFDAGAVKSGVDSIKGMSAKVQVGANTKPALDTAESARKTIDSKSATINVSTDVKGQNVDIYVTKHVKEAYTGVNNKISYTHVPQAGSLARGTKKGRVGPRNQGGMTLTGELGYEIAWLPSENRSIILGEKGPQMVNLPKDAIVYNHEQSKDIMKKRQNVSTGSAWDGTLPTSNSGGSTTTSTSSSSSTSKVVENTAKTVAKAATDTAKNLGYVSVWWENIARKTEASQRKMDDNQKAFEKYIKNMSATLKKTGQSLSSGGGGGDAYIKSIGTTMGYYQAQLDKATKELSILNAGTSAQQKAKTSKQKKKANESAYNSGAASTAKISYKSGKKSKDEIVNLAPYIKYENGTYVIDQSKINKIKNKDKRKAIADAANKEINDRLSKKYKAEDEIKKAQEALEKFSEELYKTFFAWENELTQIWNITQKIEQSQKRISNIDAFDNLLEAQIGSGRKSASKESADTAIANFRRRIEEQQKVLEERRKAIDQSQKDLKNALTTNDEETILTEVNKKLSADTAYNNKQKQVAAAQQAKNAYDAAVNDKKNQEKARDKVQKKIDKLEKKKNKSKKEKAELKKLKEQKKAINDKIAQDNKIIGNNKNIATQLPTLQKELNDLTGNLNETQRAGYEEYKKELQKRIEVIKTAQEFGKVTHRADGTIDIEFDTEKFEQERLNGNLTEEMAKAVQDYWKDAVELRDKLLENYEELTNSVAEFYTSLKDLKDQAADYSEQLVNISEQSEKKKIDNLKQLSNNLKDALDRLLKDVKNKLDERRKQEDNRKTERDISQKQQRLAALRADTSGGHQVEIAQLEKEIAEAQQDYQRSLEDQLIDKLQQQADLAAEQRERQIALQEELVTSVNNIAQVNMWMAHPEDFEDAMRAAYYEANNYENSTAATQDKIARDFESLYQGILSNKEEQAIVSDAINSLEQKIGETKTVLDQINKALNAGVVEEEPSIIEQIEGTQENKDITLNEAKANNMSLADARSKFTTATFKDFKDVGKYTAQEFKQANISYADAKAAGFTLDQLKTAGYTEAETEINKNAAKTAYDNFLTARGSKKNSGDKNWGKIGKDGLAAQISRGNILGYKETKVLQDLASTDALDWAKVLKAYIKVKGSKKAAANVVIPYFSTNATSARKSGWKTAFGKAFPKYATGGLANYTGPAWLDGTPSKPELVLNAKDTANFIALKDVLSKAMSSTQSINNSYGGDNIFEININVDKIEKDYDVDKVAERIKKIIVKDSSYRNVTQVRNFR